MHYHPTCVFVGSDFVRPAVHMLPNMRAMLIELPSLLFGGSLPWVAIFCDAFSNGTLWGNYSLRSDGHPMLLRTMSIFRDVLVVDTYVLQYVGIHRVRGSLI